MEKFNYTHATENHFFILPSFFSPPFFLEKKNHPKCQRFHHPPYPHYHSFHR